MTESQSGAQRAGPERIAFLGLGSNVGDRRAHLQAAVAALGANGVEVLDSSSVYETEPVGEVLDQREFFNACLRVRTAHGPEALLAAAKAVERQVGRTPGGARHGPRRIDVDLLLVGDVVLCTPRLELPHPEVCARRFVLVGLLELDPGLGLPDGRLLADVLTGLGAGQSVRRVGAPLDLG